MIRTFLVSLLTLLFVFASAGARELPRRAFFGAQLTEATPEQIEATKLTLEGGVALAGIVTGSSAEAAGFKDGDILISLNGEPLTDVETLRNVISSSKAGTMLQFKYVRGTEQIPGAVQLKEYPRETPEDFDVLYDAVEIDDSLRRIIFTKPREKGKFPLVVLMGGLGCYSVDVPPPTPFAYREVLYALTRAGFATLRVEKTGQGDSEGPPCEKQSFFDETNGYITVLHDLDRFKFVDQNKIIYFGHSMGGLTAPVVYQEVPCAGICAVGTGAISWIEYELANQRKQLVLAETPYDSLEIQQQQKELAMHLLFVEKWIPDQILAKYPDLEPFLEYPAHYTYMQEVANLNLSSLWKNIDTPCLFIHGSADFVSDAYEHAYNRDVVNYYHPGRAEYLEFPGMDHFFLKAESEEDAFANLIAGLPRRDYNDGIHEPIIEFCRKAVGM
ncbi:alpha/beta fold hydrolase [bacterium]|nr:alpha/beta fold hydrolase [bacterium]